VPLAASGRLIGATGVALAWFGGHAAASCLVAPPTFAVPLWLTGITGAALLGLFALQAAITLRPDWALVRRLYPWAYGGFYVDERVSRALLARWPVPDPPVSDPAPITTLAGARR
jgi:NAD(P)H-quinone oxidoreductase subunit 5